MYIRSFLSSLKPDFGKSEYNKTLQFDSKHEKNKISMAGLSKGKDKHCEFENTVDTVSTDE